MNKIIAAGIISASLLATSAFADPWVGGNTGGTINIGPGVNPISIPKATIRTIKIRTTDNTVRFKINERNDVSFNFDGSTTNGKNILASLYMAMNMGSEVVFYANCVYSTVWRNNECGVDEVILGTSVF